MNRPLLPLILISLLFPLSCGGKDGGALGVDEPIDLGPPLVLQPHELCSDSDNPANTIGTFEDANVEGLVRYYFTNQFNQTQGQPLFCPLLAQVSHVEVLSVALGIESLVGVQNLPGGVIFELDNNLITDLSPLRGLRNLIELGLDNNPDLSDLGALSGVTSLTHLRLRFNSIIDIGALRGLTNLRYLTLTNNPDLTDIQPLLDNTGLGAGDEVLLAGTNVSCLDVALLEAKGVTVASGCP